MITAVIARDKEYKLTLKGHVLTFGPYDRVMMYIKASIKFKFGQMTLKEFDEAGYKIEPTIQNII